MDRKTYLIKIIKEFDDWYQNDPHNQNKDFYKKIITRDNIESLNDNELLDFFYEFINDGGRVQSGGYRTKNIFKKEIGKNLSAFRKYVVEPFYNHFNLNVWIQRLDAFTGSGIGIATIYLNRIDCNKYPIMNNKTLKALAKLGYQISGTKNLTNYLKVKKIQNQLIAEFPLIENLYKADALNHFIVAVYKGQVLISDYLQIESFQDGLEQNEIDYNTRSSDISSNPNELYLRIKECEKEESERVTIKGKTYKRYNYLMVQIKRYRKFKCQFCNTTILKENGTYYIEACHIKAKAEGKKDQLNNILVLCPNCHKLFDYAKRENEIYLGDIFSVILNGKTYKASLK